MNRESLDWLAWYDIIIQGPRDAPFGPFDAQHLCFILGKAPINGCFKGVNIAKIANIVNV